MEFLIGAGLLYFVGRKALVYLQNRSQQVAKNDTMAVEGYIRDDENYGVGQYSSSRPRLDPDHEEEDKKKFGIILGDYEYATGKADPERTGSTTSALSNNYFVNYNYNDMQSSPGIQPAFNFPTVP